jgi:hypothetical protein
MHLERSRVIGPSWSARSGAPISSRSTTAMGCLAGTRVSVVCTSGGPVVRTPGGAGSYPARSAESTGAVKSSPAGPSAASREAVALTVAGWRSYAVPPAASRAGCVAAASRRLRKRRPCKATRRGWVGASTLCLAKTPGEDGLAALLLLVRGGTAEPTGDALAPTADAGVLRCPGCRPLTGHFIGGVLQDTRQRAAVGRGPSAGTTPPRGPATRWSAR